MDGFLFLLVGAALGVGAALAIRARGASSPPPDIDAALELAARRDMARDADDAPDASVAQLATELREPMQSILGYADVLREELDERGLDGLKADAEKVRASGARLMATVESFTTKGRPPVMDTPFEPETAADAGVRLTTTEVMARHNAVDLACPPDLGTIRGPAGMFTRALAVLIRRANQRVHHGRIRVEVGREDVDGKSCLVAFVRHSGPAPEDPDALLHLLAAGAAETAPGADLRLARAAARAAGGDVLMQVAAGRSEVYAVYLAWR